MKNSGYDFSDRIIANRAAGYHFDKDPFVNAPFLEMSLPYAAGFLYSTVDDLLIWDQALYAGKPLTPASMQQMLPTTAINTDLAGSSTRGSDTSASGMVVASTGLRLFSVVTRTTSSQ